MGLFSRRPPAQDEISIANSKFFKSEPDELPGSPENPGATDSPVLEAEPETAIYHEEAPSAYTPEFKESYPQDESETTEASPSIEEPVLSAPDPVIHTAVNTEDGKSLLEKIDSIVLHMKEIGVKREDLLRQLADKEAAIGAIRLQLAAEQVEMEQIGLSLHGTDEEWNKLKAELKRLTD